MTEKEKAAAGKLYNANYDPQLLVEREHSAEICYDFNHARPAQREAQMEVLRTFFGRTKGTFCILPPFHCDYGYNVEIGENFFANYNCVMLDAARIRFGDNVFVAPNCCFTAAGHPLDVAQRNEGLEYAYPISVGNNVWIGAGVTVLPGVTIGDNCVIGAGSVVNRDVPANSVAVGNPCRVLRAITDDDRLKYKL